MKNLIDRFTNQLEEGLKIGRNAKFTHSEQQFENVLICGLGGSGIGGTLVQNLTQHDSKIPITVHKSYILPGFVSEKTLVIISSYSGNTEETVACLEAALNLDCKIVCISAGGQIEEIATANKLDYIKIPGGMPPRACLGYSSIQLFYTLYFFGVIDISFESELGKTIELLNKEKEALKSEAKKLADLIHGNFPIIYSADNFEAVSVRIRQQFNENSKMLSWHAAIPEMNHNELVGWRIKDPKQFVIFIRNVSDLPRIQSRMELNKTIISEYAGNIYDLWSKGTSDFQRAYYLILLGDWLSLYLSELRNVDVTEVKVIDFLKGELAKD